MVILEPKKKKNKEIHSIDVLKAGPTQQKRSVNC